MLGALYSSSPPAVFLLAFREVVMFKSPVHNPVIVGPIRPDSTDGAEIPDCVTFGTKTLNSSCYEDPVFGPSAFEQQRAVCEPMYDEVDLDSPQSIEYRWRARFYPQHPKKFMFGKALIDAVLGRTT